MPKDRKVSLKSFAKQVKEFLYYDNYTKAQWLDFKQSFKQASISQNLKINLLVENTQGAYVDTNKLFELIDDCLVERMDADVIYQSLDRLHELYAQYHEDKVEFKNALHTIRIFYHALQIKISNLDLPVLSKLAMYAYTKNEISIASVLLKNRIKPRELHKTIEDLLHRPASFSKIIKKSHPIPMNWMAFYDSPNDARSIIDIVLASVSRSRKGDYWEMFLKKVNDCLRQDAGVAREVLLFLHRWDGYEHTAESMMVFVRILRKLAQSSIDPKLIVDLLHCEGRQSFSHSIFSLNDPGLNVAYLQFVKILRSKVTDTELGVKLFSFRYWQSPYNGLKSKSTDVKAFLAYIKELIRNKVDGDLVFSAIQEWDDRDKNKYLSYFMSSKSTMGAICELIHYLMEYQVLDTKEILKLFSPNRVLKTLITDNSSSKYFDEQIAETFDIYKSLLECGDDKQLVFNDIVNYFDPSIARDCSCSLYSKSIEHNSRLLMDSRVFNSFEFFDFMYLLYTQGMDKGTIRSILSQRSVREEYTALKHSKGLFQIEMYGYHRYELAGFVKLFGKMYESELIPQSGFNSEIRKCVFQSIIVFKKDDEKQKYFQLIRDRTSGFSKLFWVKVRVFLVHARYEIPKEIRKEMQKEEIRIESEKASAITEAQDPVTSLEPVYIQKSLEVDAYKELEALPSPSMFKSHRQLSIYAESTDREEKEKELEVVPLLELA